MKLEMYSEEENHLYYDRLLLVINDFLRARRYMKVLKNWDLKEGFSENRIIAEALSESTITSYTRCFVKSRTNTDDDDLHQKVAGRFTKYWKAVEATLVSPLSNQHHRLRDKRRNYFGHSSAQAHNQSHSKNYLITMGHNPFYPFEEPDMSWTAELIEFWIENIEAEIQETKSLFQSLENNVE